MTNPSPDPTPKPESLEIDLAQSFLPAWARGGDGKSDISKLAARFDRGNDRPERHGGFDKRGDQRRGPRPDRENRGNDRPKRDDRPRPNQKDRREETVERKPAREEVPALAGWQVRFLPDRTGVEGLARQIKASMKAYPLFDLARLVLEKSERYQVEFKRTDETAQALYQLKSDGSLWMDESSAISHALNSELEKFYRRERIATEAPKGNFTGVAQCGMSGILLGPPNYHGYQSKLREVHAQKFPHMSLDAYTSRIRVVKDEAVIEQWKQEQSSRDQFVPVKADAAAPEPVVTETSPAETATEPMPDEIVKNETIAQADAPATEPVDSAEVAEETVSEETVIEEPNQSAVDQTAEINVPSTPALATMADVEAHFRANHVAGLIVRIRERVVAPGTSALNTSAPAILALTRAYWAELDRFPLPLAHSLSKQLTARGLQIFKARDNITFISIARPHVLDTTVTPVSDALGAMLEYVAAHPFQPRPEQWKALTALRRIAEGGTEADRDSAVAADLSWLLHAGHVIDYAKRGLAIAQK
jgi:hypothetical protein